MVQLDEEEEEEQLTMIVVEGGGDHQELSRIQENYREQESEETGTASASAVLRRSRHNQEFEGMYPLHHRS